MMKRAREARIKREDEEAKKTAKPELVTGSRVLGQSKDGGDVVSRLYECQKLYEEKQQERKDKLLEAVWKCTSV
jgi:hypothetical protein